MNLSEKISFEENIETKTLGNGLNVILDRVANCKTAAIGFFLKNGSRDESENELGFSHFCEHMLFKGTEKFSQKDLSKVFDKMGGFINAYTTHESVAIYNRVPSFFLKDTIEIMHDMYTNSSFTPSELETERDVILNEIKIEEEEPHDRIHESFMKNIFPNDSLGLPIIGTKESIENVPQKVLFDFYKKRFNLKNLMVVISGNFTETDIETLEKLSFSESDFSSIGKKADQGDKNKFFTKHPSEQTHLILGTSRFTFPDEMQFKTGLLNNIIGESMSSRLFQKIREELGLCYNVYSFFNRFRTENLFGVYLSVMPKNTEKAVDSIAEIFSELVKNGIKPEELEQAKSQKSVEIILNSDLIQKRLQRLAFTKMNFNRIFTLNELLSIIQNTTTSELNEMIKNIFVKENFIIQLLNKKDIKLKELSF